MGTKRHVEQPTDLRAAASYGALLRGQIADRALGTTLTPAAPTPWRTPAVRRNPGSCDGDGGCRCVRCELQAAVDVAGDGLMLLAPADNSCLAVALATAAKDLWRTPQLRDIPPTPELLANIAGELSRLLGWPSCTVEDTWEAATTLLNDTEIPARLRLLGDAILTARLPDLTVARNRSWELAATALWLIEHPDATMAAHDTLAGRWLATGATETTDQQIAGLLRDGHLTRVPFIDRTVLSASADGHTRRTAASLVATLSTSAVTCDAATRLCDLERAVRQGNVYALARKLLAVVLDRTADGRARTHTAAQRWQAAVQRAGNASCQDDTAGSQEEVSDNPFLDAHTNLSDGKTVPMFQQLARRQRKTLHVMGWDQLRWDRWVTERHHERGLCHGSILERKAHEALAPFATISNQTRYSGDRKKVDLHVQLPVRRLAGTRTRGVLSLFVEMDGPFHFTGYPHTADKNAGTLRNDRWKARWMVSKLNTDVDVLVRVHHRHPTAQLHDDIKKVVTWALRNGWPVVELGGPGLDGRTEWTKLPSRWRTKIVGGVRFAAPRNHKH